MLRNVLALIPLSVCGMLATNAQQLTKAEDLYQHTDYRASLALLDKNSTDAATNFLIGRNYFMAGDLKLATDYLQRATESDPNNSEYLDWLGRVYGKRAETGNVLAAPSLASKARQSFERAVELNPRNSDALADLFDYYVNAPGFMGGGYEKALALANKTAAIDPPEGHYEKAKLAQKRKEYAKAEAHLRQAIAADPKDVGHLVALAKFLATQGRTDESDAVFVEAAALRPDAPSVWYARADVLIKQKRDLREARNLLQRYLHAPLTPDDPSRDEAARLLKQTGGA
jgi:tetratricopeptide (TPR) repeat protein